MRVLVRLIGVVSIAIGVLGIAAPQVILEAGRSLLTPAALYIVAALRLALGFVLVRAAAISRTPVALRLIGALIMVAGVLTPVFGVERSRAVLDWWSTRGFASLRAAMAVAVVFGVFLILAVLPRESGSDGKG